jgi:serine/threonine protein kinase
MVLHLKRILHRDLKSDKIFLDEAFEPRIAGFGLSKFVAEGHSHNDAMFEETIRFMAPEIHKEAPYHWSVDV